ncbi:MAG: VWA domain-containing protein [Acidobacteria bacterium]|jgi:VWFA-related protein|nr:VWA domain-containing protein [Acidobacteriota bacterium]
MQIGISNRFSSIFIFLIVIFLAFNSAIFAQSRPQKPDVPKGTQKKNQRPLPKTEEEVRQEEERKKLEEERKRLEEEVKNAVVDDEVIKIKTNLVNVDAVVYNKKTGQIITGLKKENFAVFENGIKQEITNFATPEAPITVSLVVEYSKWSEIFGAYASRGQEAGKLEVVRPVAYFLSKFIKPPGDYASVIAFDMRPTPITDFTNDPNRLRQTVDLLLRNNPAFRENNLFDAVKFALIGGRGDTVVLENSKARTAQYGGMIEVQAKRRAIILVASGIDTFSRTNYDQVRKIIQNAGIPIYILSTGNLFYKMYESQLDATDSISGMPGRLTFLQAQNAMNTFAKESGGAHFPITFEGEIPSALNSINGLLRNQYSIAYDATEKREPGKKYKLEVRVDVNGDGQYEEKQYTVQHRPFFTTPKAPKQ